MLPVHSSTSTFAPARACARAAADPPVVLQRLPLGTSYTAVAERVRVAVDTTGVALPVFEMMRAAGVRSMAGVSIHGGDAVNYDRGIFRVPKRDLVSTLQVLLQSGRLKFAADLPDGQILRHELQSFKAKINLQTGHDTYEAWREGDHDDLVLLLAMACWLAGKMRAQDWSSGVLFLITDRFGRPDVRRLLPDWWRPG